MQLDEFKEICEENDHLQRLWNIVVETALELEINELPIALKAYHGKEVLKEEEIVVAEYREKFNRAVAELKDICRSLDIEPPKLYVSEICAH